MSSSSHGPQRLCFSIVLPGGTLSLRRETVNVALNPDESFYDQIAPLLWPLVPANAGDIQIFTPDSTHIALKTMNENTTARTWIQRRWLGKTFRARAINLVSLKDSGRYDGGHTVITNWPKDFPFVCITPAKVIGATFSLRKGQFGKIVSRSQQDGSILVSNSSGTTARVMCDHIQAGHTRKYDDLVAVLDNKALLASPIATAITGSTQTFRAIKALLDELNAKVDTLQFDCDEIATDEQRNHWATEIDKGIRRVNGGQLHRALQNPNFTRRDIISNAEPITPAHRDKCGIYWRDYSNFRIGGTHRPNILPTFNIGSSINIYSRHGEHESELANVTNRSEQHYKMGSEATQRNAYTVCYCPSTDTKILKLFEQVMILLLESQRPSVVGDPRVGAHPTANNLSRRSEESLQEGGEVNMVRAATMLKEVANAAKAVSGWPGGTSRSAFNAIGNNWNQPIYEVGNFSRAAWARYVKADGTECYTRASKLVGKKGYITFRFAGSSRGRYQPSKETLNALGFNQGGQYHKPDADSEIKITFEIAPDGRQHPHRVYELPQEWCWEDRPLIEQFAIRLEWEGPGGRWRQTYDRRSNYGHDLMDSRDGLSFVPIANIRAIIAHFRHESYQGDSRLPSWQPFYGPARLYEVSVDYLGPTLNIKTFLTTSKPPKLYPRRRTRADYIQKLQNLGADRVDAADSGFGPHRDSSGQLQKYEFSCTRKSLWPNPTPAMSARVISNTKAASARSPWDFEGHPGKWVPAPSGNTPESLIMKADPVPETAKVGRIRRVRFQECDRCWVARWPDGQNSSPHPNEGHSSINDHACGGPSGMQARWLEPNCSERKPDDTGEKAKKLTGFTNTCVHCLKFGMPCSYTETVKLESNTALVKYLKDTGAELHRVGPRSGQFSTSEDIEDPILTGFSVGQR